jgi:Cu2+-exporting ATPase
MTCCPEHREEHKEHGEHRGHTPEMFIKKFWLSFILTIPVVLYSDLPQKLFGWQAPTFGIWNLELGISLTLSSIVFFYGGWVFIVGAWRELKAKLPGMMTLIALAISVAYIYSVYVVILGRGHTLFWELTTLISVMLLGHYLEMKAIAGTQSALKELSKLLPDNAEVIHNGKTEIVPLEKLKINDVVFVRPGSRIPADGVVVEGKSEVNESMITGESKPVIKEPEKEVIAGTINADGSLKIRVEKIGERTFLAGVRRLVAEAQASKSRLQILSDRAAFYLTIIAVVAGALTLSIWLLFKAEPSFALERLVAVLVIACPHALGLAIPLVASISTGIAAGNGFLVRQRLALETARKIDVVLFDKTGTLTRGEYGVEKIMSMVNGQESKVLQLAASVDSHSEHFIAKAIVKEAKNKNLNLLEVKDFKRIPGKGTSGIINGDKILVGGEAILEEIPNLKFQIPKEIKELAGQGKTIIYVIVKSQLSNVNGKLLGAIALADIIREESRQAIKELKEMAMRVAMITGDSEDVAKWAASELKIEEYFARVLPGEKAEIVKQIQNSKLKIKNSHKRVAFVGDGINDAPALTQADLGIAIGAGTNVAIESAGIILVRNDPRDIVKIIKLSRLTYNKMLQNLFWATGYNVVALPLAAGVLYFKGILLQPALAALFMSLSTIIVAINALLLKRKRL